jgi:hypothetical protein
LGSSQAARKVAEATGAPDELLEALSGFLTLSGNPKTAEEKT